MKLVDAVDRTLAPLYKGAPQLSAKNKDALAGAWPWIALIIGILQLLAAWALWQLANVTNSLATYADQISRAYGGTGSGISGTNRTLIYVGVALLAVEAVMLLAAYPKLKRRQRSGWDLLYLGALINVAYAVLSLFINGQGVGNFIMSLIGSAIGFWLLYQVKDRYKGAKTA